MEICAAHTDASLTSNAAYRRDDESSARLIPAPEPVLPKAPPFRRRLKWLLCRQEL